MEYFFTLVIIMSLSLFLDIKYHIHLYQSPRERWLIPLLFFIIGSIWDNWAVWRGYWNFEGKRLLGISIGFLPIEEYLFFLIFPYFLLTIYFFFKREIK
jgi:lycopene cyclase domain-containing protein